jgi:CDGSH-type Zn-finger protein
VSLIGKIIVPKGKGYVYEEGRTLPSRESYALCRCGIIRHYAVSAMVAHTHVDFRGQVKPHPKKLYRDRAV